MIKYTCGAGTPEEAETNCTYFIRGECTASFCEYRRKKQTNADRIRAMSDEELAEFLCDFRGCDTDENTCIGCKGEQYCRAGHAGTIDWLKQSAEEVER